MLFYNKIFIACVILGVQSKPMVESELKSLQQVHILFRHGDRTNDVGSFYPKDPHKNQTYSPYGVGQLTNKGKKRQYRLGKALRERYDKFLGSYAPGLIEAYSTGKERTKVSLQLVLAGLFPPTKEQIWETGINWQPIPYNTKDILHDTLLWALYCPKYIEIYEKYLASPQFQEQYDKDKETFDFLTEHTGLSITTYKQATQIYLGLTTEKEFGLTLPEWSKKVYPKKLEEFAIKGYINFAATKPQKKYAYGYLVQKIINDSKANINNERMSRKMYFYSGHELNVALMLLALDVYYPHVPPYGSYVLVELHKIRDVYGYKFYYQDYTSREPQLLKLPSCEEFCPIDQFVSLMEEDFPEKDSCGDEQPERTMYRF